MVVVTTALHDPPRTNYARMSKCFPRLLLPTPPLLLPSPPPLAVLFQAFPPLFVSNSSRHKITRVVFYFIPSALSHAGRLRGWCFATQISAASSAANGNRSSTARQSFYRSPTTVWRTPAGSALSKRMIIIMLVQQIKGGGIVSTSRKVSNEHDNRLICNPNTEV